MSNVTADDIIKMALGANAGIIERKKKAQSALSTGYQKAVGSGGHHPGDGHDHDGDGKPYDNPWGVEPGLLSAIERMRMENPFGPDAISIGSGWRSIAEQADLYDRWRRGEYNVPSVAPPGRSNHNHGTAADLKYASPDVQRWVAENAARYGLHFPVRGENWHAELVG